MSKYKKFEDDISKMAPIFSKRVKKLLAENAMTQKDLAEKIDVSESSVSGWLMCLTFLWNISVDVLTAGRTMQTIDS